MPLRLATGRANTGVVFIGAAAHSGSTLLGLMLGAHPQVFYAGEASKNGKPEEGKRFCKICGPGCAVWRDGIRLLPGDDLYEILSRRTRRPIVLDSTKYVPWIETQVLMLRDVVTLHLIVLARDGRAVVNAWRRKRPQFSVREHARAWLEQMRAVEHLTASWPGEIHHIRYEELTSSPETVLKGVSSFLGVPFDPITLDPWNEEQHILGGNAGTRMLIRSRSKTALGAGFGEVWPGHSWYTPDRTRLAPDLRWRNEFREEDLAVFDEIAGAANRAYVWNEGESAR